MSMKHTKTLNDKNQFFLLFKKTIMNSYFDEAGNLVIVLDNYEVLKFDVSTGYVTISDTK